MATERSLLRRAAIFCALLLGGLHMDPASAAETPAAPTALDRYLSGLTTWSADFRQSVIDGRGKQLDEGQGRLVIVRPGKFRWESTPAGAEPGAQVLIADGRNLWFLDRDLQQATVRPLSEALPQSPAMLLAGGADLRAAFDLRADGRRDGLDWVRVLPRDARSDFREAAFGFQGEQLLRMTIVDKLGQRSTLAFSRVERNRAVDPQLVTFTLPKGVDLIGTPLSP